MSTHITEYLHRPENLIIAKPINFSINDVVAEFIAKKLIDTSSTILYYIHPSKNNFEMMSKSIINKLNGEAEYIWAKTALETKNGSRFIHLLDTAHQYDINKADLVFFNGIDKEEEPLLSNAVTLQMIENVKAKTERIVYITNSASFNTDIYDKKHIIGNNTLILTVY